MALDSVFMRVDLNNNFFENDVCTMLINEPSSHDDILQMQLKILQWQSKWAPVEDHLKEGDWYYICKWVEGSFECYFTVAVSIVAW